MPAGPDGTGLTSDAFWHDHDHGAFYICCMMPHDVCDPQAQPLLPSCNVTNNLLQNPSFEQPLRRTWTKEGKLIVVRTKRTAFDGRTKSQPRDISSLTDCTGPQWLKGRRHRQHPLLVVSLDRPVVWYLLHCRLACHPAVPPASTVCI